MADRPIIFSAPMINALLAGRKTQTRRIFTPPKPFAADDDISVQLAAGTIKPRYAPGDRLWVKENFCFDAQMDGFKPSKVSKFEPRGYPANNWIIEPACMMIKAGRLRAARFMPRWASRLTLTVTEVRVQRLQEISAYDVQAEGACELACVPPIEEDEIEAREIFRDLWNSLHGPDAWDANPWVVALTFTVQHGNIDQIGTAQ